MLNAGELDDVGASFVALLHGRELLLHKSQAGGGGGGAMLAAGAPAEAASDSVAAELCAEAMRHLDTAAATAPKHKDETAIRKMITSMQGTCGGGSSNTGSGGGISGGGAG